jgi:nitrate reductase NapAB chaperone NapD
MKTLQKAFESVEEPATVEFKGPLASMCVDALRKVYAKTTGENLDEDGDNVVIMESAEMDATLLSSISRMISTGTPSAPVTPVKNDVIYTVNKDETNNETLVDLTKEMVNHTDEEGRFIVVIDGTRPSVNGQNFSKPSERTEHVSDIETIANAFNVPVYESLKSFVLNYR